MSILITLLGGLLTLTLLVVILSYSIAWYEAANSDPRLLDQRFSPGALLLAFRLILQESGFLFLALLGIPFGLGEQRGKLPEDDGKPPVILLHGLLQNRACWWVLRLRLRRAGFRRLLAINLPAWNNIETLTEKLAKTIDRLRLEQGVDRVVLVGHSMGGIIARNYLQRRGGAAKVSHCLQLGSPNHGSRLAAFAFSPLGRLLLPGSEFLRELNRQPAPEKVRLSSITSRHDNIVLPPDLALWQDAEQTELKKIGHIGLLFHPASARALLQALAEPTP